MGSKFQWNTEKKEWPVWSFQLSVLIEAIKRINYAINYSIQRKDNVIQLFNRVTVFYFLNLFNIFDFIDKSLISFTEFYRVFNNIHNLENGNQA